MDLMGMILMPPTDPTYTCGDCGWQTNTTGTMRDTAIAFHQLQRHFRPDLTCESLTLGSEADPDATFRAEQHLTGLFEQGPVYLDGELLAAVDGEPLMVICGNYSLQVHVVSARTGRTVRRFLYGDIFVHH